MIAWFAVLLVWLPLVLVFVVFDPSRYIDLGFGLRLFLGIIWTLIWAFVMVVLFYRPTKPQETKPPEPTAGLVLPSTSGSTDEQRSVESGQPNLIPIGPSTLLVHSTVNQPQKFVSGFSTVLKNTGERTAYSSTISIYVIQQSPLKRLATNWKSAHDETPHDTVKKVSISIEPTLPLNGLKPIFIVLAVAYTDLVNDKTVRDGRLFCFKVPTQPIGNNPLEAEIASAAELAMCLLYIDDLPEGIRLRVH